MTQMRGVFKPAGGQPIEVPIAVDIDGIVQVSGGPAAGGPSTADALLADIKAQLQQVYGAIDGLELITGNINLDATTINLSVDGVEGALTDILTATNNVLGLLTRLAGDTNAIAPMSSTSQALTSTDDTQLAPPEIASSILLTAIKPDGTANSGPLRYGFAPGFLPFTLQPGASVGFDAPAGLRLRKDDIWVKGSIGDAVEVSLMNYPAS